MTTVELAPYGDAALLVTAVGGTAEQRWRTVHRLADPVERLAGVSGVVPAYDTLLVEFDCVRTTFEQVAAGVRAARPMPVAFHLPVVYDGPDLADVAAELGVPAAEVVRLHTAATWTVRFRGAPAGAPMLDGSLFPHPVSRCPVPRVKVAPGSVAVAGRHSVIYPVASPGGWRLIGHTSVRLLALGHRPGDLMRFRG
jgi:KipI family sensor histidine kinase inhibitor